MEKKEQNIVNNNETMTYWNFLDQIINGVFFIWF